MWDDTGVRSCNDAVVRLDAIPTDEFHAQLVWDHPDADFDLHVLREGGTEFTTIGDTYFSNRTPNWFPDTPESNPRLDVDDDEGFGPENTNIERPKPGSRWQILVHYWNKQTDGDPFAIATLRLYAKGQNVAEVQQPFEDDEILWRALEVTWPEDPDALPTVTQLGVLEGYPRPF